MASVLAVAALVSVLWFAVGYSWAFTPGSSWLGGGSRMWFDGLDYKGWPAAKWRSAILAPHIPSRRTPCSSWASPSRQRRWWWVVVEAHAFFGTPLFIGLADGAGLCAHCPLGVGAGRLVVQLGALDLPGSGGTINAGVAGRVRLVSGPRRGYGREPFELYYLGLTMVGACLLWVGWFRVQRRLGGGRGWACPGWHWSCNAHRRPAGAIAWMMGEWVVRQAPLAAGAVFRGLGAGLVAITPAAGFVTPVSALLIGAVAGLACDWGATGLKRWLGADALSGRVWCAWHWRHCWLAAYGGWPTRPSAVSVPA